MFHQFTYTNEAMLQMWNIININYVFLQLLFGKNGDNTLPFIFNMGTISKSIFLCYGRIKIRKKFFINYHMIFAAIVHQPKVLSMSVLREMARKNIFSEDSPS